MVRKPPYSFKRLVNVYKVRLSVYKIKRYRRIPSTYAAHFVEIKAEST